MPSPSYESTVAYLRQRSYDGGMDPYYDFLRLFATLLQNNDALPVAERLTDLAYHLNDEQRHWLHRCAAAANRLDDATIAAAITDAEYHAQKARRFGTHNPQRMKIPFWIFMVQRRWNAYQARTQFDMGYQQHMAAFQARLEREQAGEGVEADTEADYFSYGPPVWCFDRFGVSHTRLPDGRVLFIAGEHEDYYDPDFQIYNDVVVIDPDLRIAIYGYPEDVFPPTDFHSATLVGDDTIYIIGNLGYVESRRPGETPVYRLNTTTMKIEAVPTSGAYPGWIFRHTAEYVTARNAIKVTGGKIFTGKRGAAGLRDNRRSFWLDLTTMRWSKLAREGHARP